MAGLNRNKDVEEVFSAFDKKKAKKSVKKATKSTSAAKDGRMEGPRRYPQFGNKTFDQLTNAQKMKVIGV